MSTLRSLVLSTVVMAVSSVAHAFPCGTGHVGSGGTNFACVNGPAGNSNDANTIDQNNLTLFGFNDWTLLSKKDTGRFGTFGGELSEPVDIDLTVIGTLYSGIWSFDADTWDGYDDIMIVLKDGKFSAPAGDVFWGAYLVGPEEFSSGTWSMGGGFNARALSHFSVYGRGDGNTVPEPGTLALLAAALAGVWGVRRRK